MVFVKMSSCFFFFPDRHVGKIDVLLKPKQHAVSGVHTTPRGAHEG